MAKAKKATKPKKIRQENYETKLKVNASFEDVIGWSVEGNPKPKTKPLKK